ncbi:hypothetical protein LCGC14_0142930 [marine sediment metagenome]|uniref:GDT1 family protein n=1 Tax=marine sediment metagenome TaxID=412755 RepID=A0A0F9Y2W7_9ZZZZ
MQTTLFIAFVVFMAEIGCLLRSACLVTEYGKATVIIGTAIGLAVATGVGVSIGGIVEKWLPHDMTHWIAGFILILVGAFMMINKHACSGH